MALFAAEDEVKINAMNANAALRSVIVAIGYKSVSAKPITYDSKPTIPWAIEFLKNRQVPAVWANPENKSDSQLLKAFLGTKLTCSSLSKDTADKRISVQTECVVSRREIVDKSKELTFQNTQDKVLWDVPSPEVFTTESELGKQIQGQLQVLLEQFVTKYKKDDFKTQLAESYYKLIK